MKRVWKPPAASTGRTTPTDSEATICPAWPRGTGRRNDMASIHQLRQLRAASPGNRWTFFACPRTSPLVASLILLVTAIAASLATVAIVGGLRSSAGPAPFVSHALGPHDPSFLLDRRWDDLTRVSIAGGGVAVRHDGTALKLTATGTGSAAWTRHAWGVERPTSFGRESIVVAAPRTEEYLTVQRRLGPRTWRWRLESHKSVPRLEADGSLSLTTAGARAGIRVLPPVVFDAAGRDVTPQGTHWSLERRGSSRFLALRVDDSSLPLPYVIDPITSSARPAAPAAAIPPRSRSRSRQGSRRGTSLSRRCRYATRPQP